jgi:hypothetical protein
VAKDDEVLGYSLKAIASADGIGDGLVEAAERAREWELDVLTFLELQSASPAAALLWRSAGGPTPQRPITVRRQLRRTSDNRTTDVVADATDGRQLLVESKAIDGGFEDGQADGYRCEAQKTSTFAIVVAPRDFISRMTVDEKDCFSDRVAIEDLADVLESAAGRAGVDPELAASWRSRAAMYRVFSLPLPGHPDPTVQAFAEDYRLLAIAQTAGRVQLDPRTMKNTGAYFTRFWDKYPATWPLALQHKLTFGELDLRVPKWTETSLTAHLDTLAKDRMPPEGWHVALPRNGRVDKTTHEVTPVLRFYVPEVAWPPPTFAVAEPALIAAIAAADSLGGWLRGGGHEMLARGPDHITLDALLTKAQSLAATLQLMSTADSISSARGVSSSELLMKRTAGLGQMHNQSASEITGRGATESASGPGLAQVEDAGFVRMDANFGLNLEMSRPLNESQMRAVQAAIAAQAPGRRMHIDVTGPNHSGWVGRRVVGSFSAALDNPIATNRAIRSANQAAGAVAVDAGDAQ